MSVYMRLTLLVCMILSLVCGVAVAIQPLDLSWTVTIDDDAKVMAFVQSPATAGFTAAGAGKDGPAVWFVAKNGTVTGDMTVSVNNASVIQYIQEEGNTYLVFTDTHDFARVTSSGETLWTWHVPLGEVSSVDAVSQGGVITAANYLHATLYRLDADGIPLWNKTYRDTSGAGLGRIQSVKTIDGGYIVAGYATPVITSEDAAGLVMCLNEDGNVIWEKRYGEKNIGYVLHINPLPCGGYIASALTMEEEAVVLILNETGDVVQLFSYPKRMELIYNADAAPNGGYYLLGYDTDLVNGKPQYLVMGISLEGEKQWIQLFGDSFIRAFIPTSDGFVAAEENGEISYFTFHEGGKQMDFSSAWMLIFVILAGIIVGYHIYRQR